VLANGNWEKKNVIEDKAYIKAAIGSFSSSGAVILS
jgi:hypothetical protein